MGNKKKDKIITLLGSPEDLYQKETDMIATRLELSGYAVYNAMSSMSKILPRKNAFNSTLNRERLQVFNENILSMIDRSDLVLINAYMYGAAPHKILDNFMYDYDDFLKDFVEYAWSNNKKVFINSPDIISRYSINHYNRFVTDTKDDIFYRINKKNKDSVILIYDGTTSDLGKLQRYAKTIKSWGDEFTYLDVATNLISKIDTTDIDKNSMIIVYHEHDIINNNIISHIMTLLLMGYTVYSTREINCKLFENKGYKKTATHSIITEESVIQNTTIEELYKIKLRSDINVNN